MGVCGRLGILNVLGPVPGDTGCFTKESVFKKPGLSPPGESTDFFGGDWGGSTRREGGCIGRGLTARRLGRVGESGLFVFAPSGCSAGRFSLSFGRIFGTAGASRGAATEAASRRRSGFGAGETGRGVGEPVWTSPVLFIFSNLARSDDTGF